MVASKEGEETEVKCIKNVIEFIESDINLIEEKLPKMNREKSEGRKEWHEGYLTAMREVKNKLEQRDEPEVLSLEFINEKAVEVYADTVDAEVHAVFRMRDLQNLLVPKQELPVIPKFVAELLRRNKKDNFKLIDTYGIALERGSWADRRLVDWLQEDWTREDVFARAWLDGYTVEEEQKYIVELPTNRENVFDEPDFYRPRAAIGRMDNGLLTVFKTRDGTNLKLHDKYLLTEQEIKDYDPRYWAFAKPIEELEE